MGSRLGFTRNLRRSQMKPTWKHDEIFPIINHAIKREYRGDERYMPSRQINAFSFCLFLQSTSSDCEPVYVRSAMYALSDDRNGWSGRMSGFRSHPVSLGTGTAESFA
jgi:hypothetical protein